MTGAPLPVWPLLAAVFAGVACWLALSGPRPTAMPQRSGGSDRDRRTGTLDEPELQRLLIAVAAGAAPVVLVGGPVGWLTAPALAVIVHRTWSARLPARERRRREEVSRSLPHVVDLLAVTLAAGAAPGTALAAVTSALEGPVVDELRSVERGLALGQDPAEVWREAARRPGMGQLGRSMARAVETGASVSDALHRLADDLHEAERSTAESRARSVGVRAAAPLGLCLLPAFVLVGVVPLVAGTVSVLLRR